jgi:hypothetical protein
MGLKHVQQGVEPNFKLSLHVVAALDRGERVVGLRQLDGSWSEATARGSHESDLPSFDHESRARVGKKFVIVIFILLNLAVPPT